MPRWADQRSVAAAARHRAAVSSAPAQMDASERAHVLRLWRLSAARRPGPRRRRPRRAATIFCGIIHLVYPPGTVLVMRRRAEATTTQRQRRLRGLGGTVTRPGRPEANDPAADMRASSPPRPVPPSRADATSDSESALAAMTPSRSGGIALGSQVEVTSAGRGPSLPGCARDLPRVAFP